MLLVDPSAAAPAATGARAAPRARVVRAGLAMAVLRAEDVLVPAAALLIGDMARRWGGCERERGWLFRQCPGGGVSADRAL